MDFFCIFRFTLSNNMQKKIFGCDWEFPLAILLKTLVRMIDLPDYVSRAVEKTVCNILHVLNDTETIFCQLGNKFGYVIIFQ